MKEIYVLFLETVFYDLASETLVDRESAKVVIEGDVERGE